MGDVFVWSGGGTTGYTLVTETGHKGATLPAVRISVGKMIELAEAVQNLPGSASRALGQESTAICSS